MSGVGCNTRLFLGHRAYEQKKKKMKQEKTHEIRENLRFKLTSCSLRSLRLVVPDAGFHLFPPRSTQFAPCCVLRPPALHPPSVNSHLGMSDA